MSAFVRATLYDPEMRLNGGSVIAYEPCSTRAMEAALLSSVLELYRKGALPGGLQDINEEQVGASRSTQLRACAANCSTASNQHSQLAMKVVMKHSRYSKHLEQHVR